MEALAGTETIQRRLSSCGCSRLLRPTLDECRESVPRHLQVCGVGGSLAQRLGRRRLENFKNVCFELLEQLFADVNVTLHEAVKRGVMDSAGCLPVEHDDNDKHSAHNFLRMFTSCSMLLWR